MAIRIERADPTTPAVTALIERLDHHLQSLYPAESNHLDSIEELSRPHVHFFGAYEAALPLGCGAVKLMPEGYGEVKRIYVAPEARGRGLGGQLLSALEAAALDAGCTLLRLETGVHQSEALAMFEKHGYHRIDRYGDYPDDPLSVFMEKSIESCHATRG